VSATGISGTGSVDITATARGGNGGNSNDNLSGNGPGGAGGSVSLTGGVTGSTSGPLSVSATGYGGSGGFEPYANNGGAGGSVILNNVVSGSTTGPMTLLQNAYGGNGGAGGLEGPAFPLVASGTGGSARSSLTVTDNSASSLTGVVQSTGGAGATTQENGIGANGGNAASFIALTSTKNGVDVNATAFATGGAGGVNSFPCCGGGANGVGGTANATASATAVGSGVATASATANGTSTGAATATSTSNGLSGQSITASATSPVGGPASAFTRTTFGGVPPPIALSPGQSFSVVNAFVGGPLSISLGSMGARYGGAGESLTYHESADFKLGGQGTILLGLLSPISFGNGFDSSTFQIFINGVVFLDQSFADLASANIFFSQNALDLGHFSGGATDIELLYSETMSSAEGFGFTYAFVATGFANAVPEPSTWAMMLLGFAVLGFLAHRRRREAKLA
jgi:hypothetical protein